MKALALSILGSIRYRIAEYMPQERDIFTIPHEFITYKMALDAVESKGSYLKYVPEILRTEKICEIAAINSVFEMERECNPWDFIPDDILTYEFCEKIIRQNPYALYMIPENILQ